MAPRLMLLTSVLHVTSVGVGLLNASPWLPGACVTPGVNMQACSPGEGCHVLPGLREEH